MKLHEICPKASQIGSLKTSSDIKSAVPQTLAIRVSQADCSERPVTVNGFCYKRFGEADQRCNEKEKDILFSERLIVTKDDYTEDDAIVENTGLGDIDIKTLNQFRNRLQSAKPDNP